MINAFNKVLAVVVSLASMIFLATVAAYSSGGINWNEEAAATDLTEYKFERIEGENPTYEIKAVAGSKITATNPEEAIGSVPAGQLCQGVLKARKHLQARQQDELNRLKSPTIKDEQGNDVSNPNAVPVVEADLKSFVELQDQDKKAIATHQAVLEKELSALNARVANTSDELSKKSLDATGFRNKAAERRKDVYRLQNELEELRTDRARLIELRRVLTDRLLRLKITNQSLKQRADQLQNGD